jgi:hypothetical protein
VSGGDDERPRLSWSEIDKRRDRGGRRDERERRPRGAAAEARSRAAAQSYLKKLDAALFAKGPAGAQGEPLARAVREAHGTPGLADACAAYLAAYGPPRDAALAAFFLDAPRREIVLAGLEGLTALASGGGLEIGRSLRGQLRMHAEGSDDDVAEAAEALLRGAS